MATPAGLCRSVLGPRVGERCDCGVSSQCRGLRASVWGHPRTVVFCGVRAFGGCASERISGCRVRCRLAEAEPERSCLDAVDQRLCRPDGLGASQRTYRPEATPAAGGEDRKSVVAGKSVSVRVDLGGRRNNKKKKRI